ncbi:MAG: PIN domain-containing protein, partial [Deltaproteobacteria bacterium]|nr:PIN domain-containing protein [Deltaproteobacteria bacterium]
MKSSGTLVDTSIWIDFFRGNPSVKILLEKFIAKDEVFISGPILYELFQGIRSPEEKKQVKEALLSAHYIEIESNDWEEAASLAGHLRAKGSTLPMTDILIGHLAKTRNLEILSFDPHFDQIPG